MFVIGYLLSVVVANIASTRWHVDVLGMTVPAGAVLAGLTLTVRDLVHETSGACGLIVGLGLGAGLSVLFASPHLALASLAAFAASELADTIVYARLRHTRLGAVAASNGVGLVLDSTLFAPLAFGTLAAIPGQLAGKAAATIAALIVLLAASEFSHSGTRP